MPMLQCWIHHVWHMICDVLDHHLFFILFSSHHSDTRLSDCILEVYKGKVLKNCRLNVWCKIWKYLMMISTLWLWDLLSLNFYIFCLSCRIHILFISSWVCHTWRILWSQHQYYIQVSTEIFWIFWAQIKKLELCSLICSGLTVQSGHWRCKLVLCDNHELWFCCVSGYYRVWQII